jgi:hypothetical protein
MPASSIDVSPNIPRRVFAPEFNDVFVMDFAWLIDRRAVDLMKMLIRVAGPPEVPVLTPVAPIAIDRFRAMQSHDSAQNEVGWAMVS